MGVKDLSLKTGNIYYISVDKIQVNEGWNIREDYGDIESFAKHILDNGITFPALVGHVENDVFYVTQGHRRRLASLKALELGADLSKGLPCVLEPKSKSPEERIAEQISTNEGKSYTPLEKALVVKKLASFHWDAKQISKCTNIQLPQVYNYIKYICPQSNLVLQMIRDNKVSLSVVLDVAKEVGVKKTYERLCELNGKDPLAESFNDDDNDEQEEDNGLIKITSLDDLQPKKKEKKIKNISKSEQIKKVCQLILKEAEIEEFGSLVQVTMTVENLELLKVLIEGKKDE
jgi:ParB-like nuclease domain